MADAVKDGELNVRLEPHVGVVSTPVGQFKNVLPQDVVFVNDVWAGYVGHDEGSQINIILSGIPDDVLAQIKAKVDELRKSKSSAIKQALQLRASNVVIETSEETGNTLEDEDL